MSEKVIHEDGLAVIRTIEALAESMGSISSGGAGLKIENNGVMWRIESYSEDSFASHNLSFGATFAEAWEKHLADPDFDLGEAEELDLAWQERRGLMVAPERSEP